MPRPSLHETAAFAKLQSLVASAPDLRQPETLNAGRIAAMKSSAVGFDLLFATQRVDNQILGALQSLADETEAVAQMRQIMAGEVMNRIEGFDCENRQVMHHAMRNVFADLARPELDGESEPLIAAAREELARLEAFLEALDSGKITNAKGETFTDMVNIGIGGSDLGPKAIYLALKAYAPAGHRAHFVSNVDPDDANEVLAGLDLSRTLVNVVSKSGSTLETLTNEELVASRFRQAGLDPAKHFVCVTGRGSPMDNPAKYLRAFYMYDSIGGRYSVSSMVGGVILGFGLGLDNFRQFLRGMRKMDLNALETDSRRNLSLLAALLGIWNRDFLAIPTLAVLPYSQALSRFAAHLQQCDMESNGKRIDRRGRAVPFATGPIVWGEPGTNGQHAFYQLIHQSETVVACDFIGFRESQRGADLQVKGSSSQEKLLANLLAQSLALASGKSSDNPNKQFPGNRPNSLLIGRQLTPESMGALLAFYENKISFQGLIWNINSFDQEGVQLGKVLANEILDALTGKAAANPATAALIEAAGLK